MICNAANGCARGIVVLVRNRPVAEKGKEDVSPVGAVR